MEDHAYAPLLLRRNGRPQACDPCRKRKLACDHTQPVCSRCKKRKQEADCVYIVSDGNSKPPEYKSPLPSPVSSAASGARSGTPRPVQNAPVARPEVQVLGLARPGYLGPTSYCNIYEDTENSLSLLQGVGSATPPQHESVAPRDPIKVPEKIMPPRIREICLAVLRTIPDPDQGSKLYFKHGSDGWVRPVALRMVKSFYQTFGHYFTAQHRSTAQLEELARILCANTARPVSDDEPNPERWVNQFMGENTRWELIGVLSIFWVFVPSSDAAAWWRGKRTAEFDRNFSIMRENLRLCTELCKEFSAGNALMLYLTQRRTAIDSMSLGDASLVVWRSHAEAVSLLTFLGFHALEETDQRQMSMSLEIKKRLFHHLFVMAMVVVSFTGRPPLLVSRYSSTPLPLDISDDELFSDHETFMKAIGRLDEKGWNTDGKLHTSTRIRARSILASIREEIFEIALGCNQTASIETLLQLRARELQTVTEFPACLHFDLRDLENYEVPSETMSSRLFVKLEHLQNMFFIERLLVRSGHEDKGDLLGTSYDLVTLTLPCYLNLDRLAAFRNDCEWLVMAYAVPAGGILCLELLKPTLHIKPHRDPRITRSNIIQKLSLLVAYLHWVSPSGPNGDLCSDAKSVIQRVLDQTLNAASSVYEPPAVFEWDFSTQVDFNFDLLDTFDWNRPDFPLSQQSNP
ncbi:uncharacterized protein F4822DRAFT_413756 [Hypoxylon trugodes]|uniref:uncharacterized protein n=1 Tax=Hypoxylon trugodes TaxID=326681 RepID=UPI00218EB6B9|nr:uncharacterized protein F4822DRAFT_413756 [Hypoxylon trugodes]KAI1385627.1 hypothetical protein F4822DRAFT_413756 [Hypoxylon trugodes]